MNTQKGLCCNCVNDKNCSFPRGFFMVECEEFFDGKKKPEERKNQKCEKIGAARATA